MSDLIDRAAAIDAIKAYLNFADWKPSVKEILEMAVNDVADMLERLPSAQSEGWLARHRDEILRAGMEGREFEFRIDGRLFAIREKAQ